MLEEETHLDEATNIIYSIPDEVISA